MLKVLLITVGKVRSRYRSNGATTPGRWESLLMGGCFWGWENNYGDISHHSKFIPHNSKAKCWCSPQSTKKSNLPAEATSPRLTFLIIQHWYEVRYVAPPFPCKTTSLAYSRIFLKLEFFKLLGLSQSWHKFQKPYTGSQSWSRKFVWNLMFQNTLYIKNLVLVLNTSRSDSNCFLQSWAVWRYTINKEASFLCLTMFFTNRYIGLREPYIAISRASQLMIHK